MPEQYVDAIMKFLAGREYQPLKEGQLAYLPVGHKKR